MGQAEDRVSGAPGRLRQHVVVVSAAGAAFGGAAVADDWAGLDRYDVPRVGEPLAGQDPALLPGRGCSMMRQIEEVF